MDKNRPLSSVWDAADYAQNSQGQFGWAMQNLPKLALTGRESVLDIGCGDGKITARLAHLLPEGRVIGVDQSPEMIALASRMFRETNLVFRHLDAQQLDYAEEFDAVFSNSAIHWMPNPSVVVHGIARALKPGGRIFLSMGGRGTAAAVFSALASLQTDPRWLEPLARVIPPHHFYGPEEYLPWLREAGLEPDRVELVRKPMVLADLAALEGWLRTTWMAYWRTVNERDRPDFLKSLTAKVSQSCSRSHNGALTMSMVNLEISAHKPDGKARDS